jgi:hypothetical protein
MLIHKSVVTDLPNERKTSGNYHCDNCDEAMLPSEIAFQDQENLGAWFCSISCLKSFGLYGHYYGNYDK